MCKIEVRRNRAGKWYYRVKGANGEIVVFSQPFASKSNAMRGVQDLQAIMADASMVVEE